jgi:hypothetical protein
MKLDLPLPPLYPWPNPDAPYLREAERRAQRALVVYSRIQADRRPRFLRRRLLVDKTAGEYTGPPPGLWREGD